MPPPINARVEKVAEGKFFRQIWPNRALVAADGWYEWVKDETDPKRKQPYFIQPREGSACFFAAIGKYPADGEQCDGDGFVITTADSKVDNELRFSHYRDKDQLEVNLVSNRTTACGA
jgi:putative SOS response-associated peptidase YedK